MIVFRRLVLDRGDELFARVASEVGRLPVAQTLDGGEAYEHKGAADRMRLAVRYLSERRLGALGRQDVDVMQFDLDLAAVDAARRIDLLHGESGAVRVVGMVGDAGRAALSGHNREADGLLRLRAGRRDDERRRE